MVELGIDAGYRGTRMRALTMAAFLRVAQAPTITSDSAEDSPLGRIYKRGFDLAFASLALLASVLPFLIIAALLKVFSPGPLFFYHERVGFQGKRFKCIKFRTMMIDSEVRLLKHLNSDPIARAEYAEMQKLRDDPRIVPGIGHFLRKSSLDELPQLINVLFGDMSIVGPRPVTAEEVELYGAQKTTYLRTRPGITGLWQVSGRSSLAFVERVRIDATYVRNWSIAQDLNIILRTAGAILNSKDAC